MACNRCSSRGNVIAANGNASGFGKGGSHVNCYSWGDVTAELTAGIAGGFDYDSSVYESCYSIGDVTGFSTGGFCVGDTGTATAVFWDTQASGEATSGLGEGHVTSWMQTQANYEAAGWDFDTVWEIL